LENLKESNYLGKLGTNGGNNNNNNNNNNNSDNIDLKEVGCKDVNWIQLILNRAQWRGLVNTGMKLRIPLKARECTDRLSDYQLFKKDHCHGDSCIIFSSYL